MSIVYVWDVFSCTTLPVSASTRQHLVHANDMVWMYTYTQMERLFAGSFDHILVGTNTSSFQCFG